MSFRILYWQIQLIDKRWRIINSQMLFVFPRRGARAPSSGVCITVRRGDHQWGREGRGGGSCCCDHQPGCSVVLWCADVFYGVCLIYVFPVEREYITCVRLWMSPHLYILPSYKHTLILMQMGDTPVGFECEIRHCIMLFDGCRKINYLQLYYQVSLHILMLFVWIYYLFTMIHVSCTTNRSNQTI